MDHSAEWMGERKLSLDARIQSITKNPNYKNYQRRSSSFSVLYIIMGDLIFPYNINVTKVRQKRVIGKNMLQMRTPVKYILLNNQEVKKQHELKDILDVVDNFFKQINNTYTSPDRASIQLRSQLSGKKLKDGTTLNFETAGPVVTQILDNLREIKDQRDKKRNGKTEEKINDNVSYTETEFSLVSDKFYGACDLIPEGLDTYSALQNLKFSCSKVGGSRKTKRTKKKTRKSRKNGKSRKLRKSRK